MFKKGAAIVIRRGLNLDQRRRDVNQFEKTFALVNGEMKLHNNYSHKRYMDATLVLND